MTIRPSAGTSSPAAISTTSPTTSCSAGISASAPSRRTRAVAFIIDCSAFIALSALPAWRSPIERVEERDHDQHDGRAPLLDHERDDRRPDQDDLHVARVLAEETAKPRRRLLHRQRVRAVALRRSAASAADRPESTSTPSLLATSAGSSAYQRSSADTGRVLALSVVVIRTSRSSRQCQRMDPPPRPPALVPRESS